MFEPRPAALSVTCTLVSILLIAACTSRPPPRGGQPGGPPGGGSPGGQATSLNGGQVARPIALLFTGMDTGHDYAIGPAELTAGISAECIRMPGQGDLLEISGRLKFLSPITPKAKARARQRTMRPG